MKLRSTTPVSSQYGIAKKAMLVASTVLMVAAAPLAVVQSVHADNFDDKMAALQKQIDGYRGAANQLSKKINSLNARLGVLTNQRRELEAELHLTQVKYDQLTSRIKQTQEKIVSTQNALGTILANMYVDGQTTPLEMLASSDNISDYVDQQSYQASMSDQLKSTIGEVKALKVKLQQQKEEVTKTLNRQKAQKNALVAKVAEQDSLIAQTKGRESAYHTMVAKSQQQLQNVASQQQAYYQSLLNSGSNGSSGVVGAFSYSGWSGNMGCSGGYPYCGPQDSYSDPWGLYNRECVSYVAWALSNRFGKYVGNFNGQGNAYQWPSSAPAYSGAVRVYNPQPGDAVILPADGGFAPVGHAMIVESVNGGSVHVSQYNFYGSGQYSTMNIGTGGVVFLRFPSR